MSKKPNIVELLTERYFGPAFMAQQKVVEDVLECVSLSDFEKLDLDFGSEPVRGVFAAASFNDPEAKKLTAEKLNQIYEELKPVRSSATFF